MSIALIPTSADPATIAHLDLVKRASKLFNEINWAIGVNPEKVSFFSVDQRLSIMKLAIEKAQLNNVHVSSYTCTTVEYAEQINASIVVRGLRATHDFQFEYEMSSANQVLNPDVDTLFMMGRPEYSAVSSSLVRQLIRFKQEYKNFIAPGTFEMIESFKGQLGKV